MAEENSSLTLIICQTDISHVRPTPQHVLSAAEVHVMGHFVLPLRLISHCVQMLLLAYWM